MSDSQQNPTQDLKDIYPYFIKPLLSFATLPYAAPTIARDLFTNPKYDEQSDLFKTTTITLGSFVGFGALIYQLNLYSKAVNQGNNQVLLIPAIASLTFLSYELAIRPIAKLLFKKNKDLETVTNQPNQPTT